MLGLKDTMKTLVSNEKVAWQIVEILAEKGISASVVRESGKQFVELKSVFDGYIVSQELFPLRKWTP